MLYPAEPSGAPFFFTLLSSHPYSANPADGKLPHKDWPENTFLTDNTGERTLIMGFWGNLVLISLKNIGPE